MLDENSYQNDEESQADLPPSHKETIWKLNEAQLKKIYGTDLENGLTVNEAEKRLKQNGKNELEAKKVSKFVQFIKQFNNSIIYILAAAAIMTFLMHRYSDSIVIGLVIIANAIIGYIQEQQAGNALEKIREMLVSKNFVFRDGEKLELDARDLVVGDLVNLEAGDAVPADMRLISADNLSIQESVLTGETNPVNKIEEPMNQDKLPLAERQNMVFASTAVTSGSGLGIVIATAGDTEIGKIQDSVETVKEKPTPLMRNLNSLGFGLSVAIVITAVLLFVVGYFLDTYSLPTLLISVITMVVGSMPEGLPASTSVVLAMGTRKMTKRKVIVKSLPAVETLGAVDIVNTDKTGTLTKNEMTVKKAVTPEHTFSITGVGYDANGSLDFDGELELGTEKYDWQKDEGMKWLVNIAGQTTDAQLHFENNRWELTGEPTDGALTTLYRKLTGKDPEVNEIDSLPFDSAFRYSARLVDFDDQRILMVKGSPTTIINASKQGTDEAYWNDKITELSTDGLRVVALAYKAVDSSIDSISKNLIENLNMAGMVGIIDPPREEARKSIHELRMAGIKVKMITGDHPDTASAIAKKLDLDSVVKAITGPEIDAMSDEELKNKIDDYNVFARTTPANKLRIVRAQQANDHVVSMTGDGVNDAPALKQADIGVAMGIKGTEVAKESANMVLADDDFSDIVVAVREGRHVFDNIRKTIRFLLPTSFAEGLIVVISILMGQELPLYPAQLLWINMVSALTIQFAFIFEPPEAGIMARGPRNVKAGLLTKLDTFEIIYVSLLISGLGIWAFDFLTGKGLPAIVGSTMALNIIIFGKIFYLFNLRNDHPVVSKYFFQNKMAFIIVAILIVLQLGIIYLPFMQSIFETTNINFYYGWFIPIMAGVIVLAITELGKFIRFRVLKKTIH
ncbi:HAD-IC family P-type ATPase [Companilactobacillus kimchii]|uniref:Cation transport ATPase n=2 Tax=Companilactobacillus kimchii TaxID=2801452 RepID=A0ABR5NSY9_9LACO|nr:HAD-IC family P-type ATPase [Companilactobacillus kimchii]KAE9562115.1 magnesium-transporting ATPase [Companilactobacillus kimchii]KRK51269.1 cation transport ATPase [Companilactobacillus kimchii DSM 13961 = JCM 10707]OWF34249.1 Proton-exporting ATPase [Companilactobacillus kimchii]GEO46163.1 magnesium-transporting ATPase [Companilactobacillus paralimentarius]